VYEHILNRSFDKRNFRKKIIALGILRETGRMQEGVKNRPAALYEFVSKTQQEISLFA
jgi:8-oxo-dGTP diphosphatase